jgi:hypothetical protein
MAAEPTSAKTHRGKQRALPAAARRVAAEQARNPPVAPVADHFVDATKPPRVAPSWRRLVHRGLNGCKVVAFSAAARPQISRNSKGSADDVDARSGRPKMLFAFRPSSVGWY